MMLASSNQPPESPGFVVFTATGSSSKGLIHKDSRPETGSKDGNGQFGKASNTSSSHGLGTAQMPHRVRGPHNTDSANNSSHFRIAPGGGSNSFNSGQDLMNTSPKLSS